MWDKSVDFSWTVSYSTYHRLRQDFLNYLPSLECIPLKMLPREILSAKAICDIIPHTWSDSVLQKSIQIQMRGAKLEVSYMRSHLSNKAGAGKRKFFFIWAKNFISVHLTKCEDQDFWHMLNIHFTKNYPPQIQQIRIFCFLSWNSLFMT